MGTKDIKPYHSKRINPYLNEPKRIGTGEPPKSAIPKIDDPLLKPPGGGGALSETALEESEERRKRINPYLPEEQGPIALPPATVEPETKTPARVERPPIPEPGEELQHELRPVEKPMTSPRPIDKEFEERKRQQQKVQHLDQVLASLQKNRKGNYRPITIKDAVYIDSLSGSGGRDAYGKIVAYRGFILYKDYLGTEELMWATLDPHSQEDIGLGYPRKLKDALKNIDELWEEESVSGGELWAQGFYDWGLIDSVESYLKSIRPTIQEGADEFEEIRQVSPVVEGVSAELLPGETFDTTTPAGWARQSLFDPKLKEGRRLLIMSCCKAKTDDPGEIPALERYAGTLFKTLKKHGIPDDVDVAILSAENGLMRINHPLSKYDKQMTKATQEQLLEDEDFRNLVQGTVSGYEDVFLAGGNLYRDTIKDALFHSIMGGLSSISEAVGSQGVKQQELKEWLEKSYYDPSEEGVVIETPESLEPPTVSHAQWNKEFMEEIRADRPPETEVETDPLEDEFSLVGDTWKAGDPHYYVPGKGSRKKRRSKLTEGFEDLVSKSLRATRKGNFPQANVGYDRLPKDIKGTGSLMFYRGFPILRRKEWDNARQKYVEVYAILPPEKGAAFLTTGTLRRTKSLSHKHKYGAVNNVDWLWNEEPEAWNKVMKGLGYKYEDRHVFDAARNSRRAAGLPEKKARGGFIDKPLYERTL